VLYEAIKKHKNRPKTHQISQSYLFPLAVFRQDLEDLPITRWTKIDERSPNGIVGWSVEESCAKIY
jgi:hypothetical protein